MNLLYLIPAFPLIGFLINGLGFRQLSKKLASLVGVGAALLSFACTLSVWISFDGTAITSKLFDWITVGGLNIAFSFQIDQLTLLMLGIITGVGSLIHIYSIGYMQHDEGFGKFFSFLNLFLFFMLLLVLAANYVVMFIGWEGVGLCSYLLIGFWNKNTEYGYAARKAFIMNRIGDLGFLLGIFMIITQFQSVEYSIVFSKAAQLLPADTHTITLITMLLFVGAMGKSAQLPLYTWLPDAMAGPTPVSALIHAATMVTAGVYMVVRSNILFSFAPITLSIITIVGIATALLAASIGLFQNDIKKVLAYSTVSQLGLMFVALGLGAYTTAMFHVMTHAFFKALLFLGAGSIIHAMSGEQDIRNMGGLRKALPITYLTFLIATVAISGFPPFAGFFSKDQILAAALHSNPLMAGLVMLVSIMTCFYMFRLFYLTFFGTFRGTNEQKHHLHESPLSMTTPLMVLAVLSVIGGFIGFPHGIGKSLGIPHYFDHFLKPVAQSVEVHFSTQHEWLLIGIATTILLATLLLARNIFISKNEIPSANHAGMSPIKKTIFNAYYIDEVYDAIFVKPIAMVSDFLHSVFEFLVIDLLVETVGKSIKMLAKNLRLTQDGSVGYYLFAMVIGIVVVVVFSFKNILL